MVRQPLQEDMKLDRSRLFLRETLHGLIVQPAPPLRPFAPAPLLLAAVPMLMQSLEQRVLTQPVAAIALEGAKVIGQSVAGLRQVAFREAVEEPSQQLVLCARGIRPLWGPLLPPALPGPLFAVPGPTPSTPSLPRLLLNRLWTTFS